MKSALRMFLLYAAALALLSSSTATSERTRAFTRIPRLVLWAWEMPERLDFIDPARVGVAYLDQTVYLNHDGRVQSRSRRQPMQVPPRTEVIAVVRVEMQSGAPATAETRAALVSALMRSARRDGVAALQIDFDATKSQQAFYADVLSDLRRDMPANMPLSVTALASWCAFDRWLAAAPIDEAVPMLFRMGREQNLFRSPQRKPLIREPLCADSLGVSVDEPWPAGLSGKRVYVFNPRPWTARSFALVLERVKQ